MYPQRKGDSGGVTSQRVCPHVTVTVKEGSRPVSHNYPVLNVASHTSVDLPLQSFSVDTCILISVCFMSSDIKSLATDTI